MNIIPVKLDTMSPLSEDPGKVMIGNRTLAQRLSAAVSADFPDDLQWKSSFFPDRKLLSALSGKTDFAVVSEKGDILAACGGGSEKFNASGVEVIYPWHILNVAELLAGELDEDQISGEISPRASVEGHIILGKNSRILPGVFIEGSCIIGDNCKIGPNCYIRGCTVIGDGCHLGQAVEIKNSVIGNNTSIGHLSYAGDCVIGSGVNFGAGTIISNYRHDKADHRTMVNGVLVDTGRRKFGSIIGDNVHTGIHTAIYPGRKLSSDASTRPGDVVKYDL